MTEKIKFIYEQKYKLLLLFPILLVLLAVIQIVAQTALTGDFVNKGITLKGGSTITIPSEESFSLASIDAISLEKQLNIVFPEGEISVRTLSSFGEINALIIDSAFQERKDIDSLLLAIEKSIALPKEKYSVEAIGSALGQSFFKETLYALLLAFLLMAIVVIVSFRLLIPSVAVVAAAFSDVVVTLAIFNLTGIKLSTAGIAAFLMLIGYSVDTDILLTNRVLKRKEGTVMVRIYGAIKTGMTMTLTTLSAILVALFFVQSEVVKQIMIILFIGLIVDMIMTWIQNVGLIRLYLERKDQKNKQKEGVQS